MNWSLNDNVIRLLGVCIMAFTIILLFFLMIKRDLERHEREEKEKKAAHYRWCVAYQAQLEKEREKEREENARKKEAREKLNRLKKNLEESVKTLPLNDSEIFGYTFDLSVRCSSEQEMIKYTLDFCFGCNLSCCKKLLDVAFRWAFDNGYSDEIEIALNYYEKHGVPICRNCKIIHPPLCPNGHCQKCNSSSNGRGCFTCAQNAGLDVCGKCKRIKPNRCPDSACKKCECEVRIYKYDCSYCEIIYDDDDWDDEFDL